MEIVLPARTIGSLDEYVARGGGGIRRAREVGPDATIAEVERSGLRGRGGAGFPTGRKWASVARSGGLHYVVANGAEGEPATFKDRMLMRRDPYAIVEGAAIAAYAVGAREVYLATKRKYVEAVANLRRAVVELAAADLLDDLTVVVVEGPDEYLFGEEKALLEVIEGREPLPRLLPPYLHGLFATAPSGGWEAETVGIAGAAASNPTVVDNVETLAAAAQVLAHGADWYRSMGTASSPGTVIATVVGAVTRPGVFEVELGTPFRELLDLAGGAREGRALRAACSGVSNAVLPAHDFDVDLSYEAFSARGTGLGAAGFALYDDTTDMVAVAHALSRFLAVESCGQCPPCKIESMAITDDLAAILHDDADDGLLAVLHERLQRVPNANRCYLGTEEQNVVSSLLRCFPEDFAAHLERAAAVTVDDAPVMEAGVPVPMIDDITDDGQVVYDASHARKRYDWTYVPSAG